MIRRLAIAAGLGFASLALAQPPVGEKDKPPAREAPLPLSGDPTKPTPKMEAALGGNRPQAQPGTVPPAPKTVGVVLRAHILRKGQPPAALLEVDGRLYTITTGSVIVPAAGVTLKVAEVNALEVRVEMLPVKETIVLR